MSTDRQLRKFSPGAEPIIRPRGRVPSRSSSSSRSSSRSHSSRSTRSGSSSSRSSSISSGSAQQHRAAAAGPMKRTIAKPYQPRKRGPEMGPPVEPGGEQFPFGEFDPNAKLLREPEAGALVKHDGRQWEGSTPALPAPPGEGGDGDDAHQLRLTECGDTEHPGGQLEIKGLPHNWFFPEVMMLLRVNGVGRWAKILELGPDDDDDAEAVDRHRKKGPETQTAIVAFARADDAQKAAQVLDGQRPVDTTGKPLECGWTTCKPDEDDVLGLKTEEVDPDEGGALTIIDMAEHPRRKKAPEPEIVEAPAEPVVKDSEWAEPGARGGWKCTLCGVFANSEQQVMVHLRGKKHQIKLRRHKEEEAKKAREEEWQVQRRVAEAEYHALRQAELEAMACDEAMGLVSELTGEGPAAKRVRVRIARNQWGAAGGQWRGAAHSKFGGLERRVDSTDNRMYTYQDFVIQYGPLEGQRRWDAAAHTSTHSPQNAAHLAMAQQAAVSVPGVAPPSGIPGVASDAWPGAVPAAKPDTAVVPVPEEPTSVDQSGAGPASDCEDGGTTGVPVPVQPEATEAWKPAES
eukprot:TRINITY_DN6797_c0_g1_i1.p1 TRINITY_DN6797_c0_g1~~TRINITY_DN6797_c0_g1_i1.p1  ORF type:complete len:573 (+),score=118.49 TRINITY_DN6797_c0_g1_i1:93-1811(+)